MTIKNYTPRLNREAISLISSAVKTHDYPTSYVQELCNYCALSAASSETLSTQQENILQYTLFQLSQQMPVEYIVQRALFCERFFYVNRDVLIPRLDTESLCTNTISQLTPETDTTIIDVGTGSGSIIISVALAQSGNKKVHYIAVDISEKALAVAKRNAETYGVIDDITFLSCDVYPQVENAPIIPDSTEIIIVSNPPYITDEDMLKLPDSVKKYEPDLALRLQHDFLTKLQLYIETLTKAGKKVTLIIEYSSQGKMIQKTLTAPKGDLRALLLS